MSQSSTNGIIGQYEANAKLNATAGTDRVATDKDTFLKLLVAQLTHQDPLNPVEDKEFIAQLAQFTTVEELENINKGVEQLNASYLAQQATNAAGLIGMNVLANGDNVYLRDAANMTAEDQYPAIYFSLNGESASGTFNVYTTNSDGTIGRMVYSTTMPGYSADGMHVARWDGRDYAGNAMPNGSYIINITAVDADGNNLLVDTSSDGTVIGVKTETGGNHKLYLLDGRTVNFNEVSLISVPSNTGEMSIEDMEAKVEELKATADKAAQSAELARDAAEAAQGTDKEAELTAWADQLEKAAEEAAKTLEEAEKILAEAKEKAEASA